MEVGISGTKSGMAKVGAWVDIRHNGENSMKKYALSGYCVLGPVL